MQPLSGNQRPDLLTSLMNMSLVLRLPRKCIFADPLQMSHACHRFWKCYKTLTFCSLLTRCTIPCACHAKRHLNVQKWSEHVCFVHFDLEMCFAPQRRALFRHLNFQKWSEHGVFCTFWLGNVLRATTACTFSTSQLPKVVRTWCVLCILTWKCASRHNGVHFFDISTSKSGPNLVCLYILTWKCASRHNGVQFFISHLASWLRTRRFSEPTFRPSGATNHWKNTVFRDFPTFSRISIFFLLTLSLLLFSLLIFLFSLSASALLCFSSVHGSCELEYHDALLLACQQHRMAVYLNSKNDIQKVAPHILSIHISPCSTSFRPLPFGLKFFSWQPPQKKVDFGGRRYICNA